MADTRSATKQDTNVKLEDFEILKVIDKGSFGKVFLVELTQTICYEADLKGYFD
jgi:hypothetical protein